MSGENGRWGRSFQPNLAIFSLTVVWRFYAENKLNLFLMTSTSNLSSCCKVPHGIYCGWYSDSSSKDITSFTSQKILTIHFWDSNPFLESALVYVHSHWSIKKKKSITNKIVINSPHFTRNFMVSPSFRKTDLFKLK